MFLLALISCTNSGNKSSIERSKAELQLLEKITNADFKNFVGTFAFRAFPWDVSETPLFADGEVPAHFHEISLEDVNKFINRGVTKNKGYYTGYAFFENEYIAIVFFHNYSNLYTDENYHTSVSLLTFSFEGKLINHITIRESSTIIYSNALRKSENLAGIIYANKTSIIKINYYIGEESNGTSNLLSLLIKPNGEIEQTDTVENKADENLLTQYLENLPPSEGLTPVRNSDNKWGYINEKGELVVECQFEGAGSFKNGKVVVKISSDEDWQKNYHYIDSIGNDHGLFFSQIDGTNCAEASVVISDIAGEQKWTHFLLNCPDGVRSIEYQGWEWSSSKTFYPNVTIEQHIAKQDTTDEEFGSIYKKFDGNSVEYKDGDYNISITVNKNSEGIITSVTFSKRDDFHSNTITFELKENGVEVSSSFG